MSLRRALVVASLLTMPSLALAAPGDDDGGTSSASDFRRTHACGTRQIPGPVAFAPPVQHAASGPRLIFLNPHGGTYHIKLAATNSATQTANQQVISGDNRPHEAVIAPLAADFPWATISACVKAYYAPYDVRFTETRPTSGTYIEAVVGGTGTELGFGADELFGIASADNFCNVTEAGIAFSFSETHRGVPRRDEELCATIAHEVGHLLALEHETLATDLMSYVFVDDTSSKSFVDRASSCGVQPGQATQCSCPPSPSATNSAMRLRDFVGVFTPHLGQGEACTSGAECEGGQCVTQDDSSYCTQTCDVDNDTCPSGWECTQAGGIAVCADPGGCCSTGGKPTSGMALLALGVGFVVVRRRRRA
jgi:MYXO-CTERM domain-containing protein